MNETKPDSGADVPEEEPKIQTNKKLSYQRTTPGIWRSKRHKGGQPRRAL